MEVPELTLTVANEYIRKIVVYGPDKSGGHRRQKVQICKTFPDEIDAPELEGTVVDQRPLTQKPA